MSRRLFSSFLAAIPFIALPVYGQAKPPASPAVTMARDAHPSLLVATVKPHDPDSTHQGIDAIGDHLAVFNQSVSSLMVFAYSIHPKQIAGAPDWALHDRWDIEGKIDTPGQPDLHQMQEMLQKLLADRFQLHFNREKRELAVYAIRVAKGGPKLKPAAHPEALADQQGSGGGTEQTLTYTSATMADFVMGEQFFLDRPVVDQTGLSRRYDFSFRYTYDEVHATDPNAPPGLFTAVQQQLGLKFAPVNAPVDVFVIDRVERPGQN
ncbi:MAG TPA: TIGR03435 family protein [Acidobacteriaceae bacterium]|nr:TIGR03435 family protein [Acidobacteriaceae bacterium]